MDDYFFGRAGAAGSRDDETQLPSLAEEWVYAENLLEETTRLGKVHRFPHYLRRICGEYDRYVVPSVVALGPYHRGRPHLEKMEKVKRHAARTLCQRPGVSVDYMYAEVLRVARSTNWRRWYEESSTLETLTDNAFARMMVWDGCFLLWFLTCHNDPIWVAYKQSCGHIINKDIFLLENQILLVVLDSIGSALGISAVDVIKEIANEHGQSLYNPIVETEKEKRLWGCIQFPCHQINSNEKDSSKQGTGGDDDAQEESPLPLHLLDFLRFGLLGKQRRGKLDFDRVADNKVPSISAVKLVESGIKLTASTARWFPDMKCKKKFFFAELSLPQLNLNDTTACWLVNMVALESLNATTLAKWSEDGYVITSYVRILASLMDREEDVRQLRKSGVLASSFSDGQTLDFFKGFGQHLGFGWNYFNILGEINSYMRRRSWIGG